MSERAKSVFEHTKLKLESAKQSLKEDRLDNAVYFIWVVFENAELNKLRLTADFKDYSLAPEIPNKEKTEHYLQEAEKLFDETGNWMKNTNVNNQSNKHKT